jgi:hypothetical protein
MKLCPVCGTTYTDASLRFCLADGNPLIEKPADQTTGRESSETDETIATTSPGQQAVRVDIPPASGHFPTAETRPDPPHNTGSSGVFFKVLIVFLLLGLLVAVLGAVGLFLYMRSGTSPVNTQAKNDAKPVTPAPTASKDDKDELRDQIANLERMLNEQKKSNQPKNVPLSLPNESAMTTTATVNSPSDGFLALRTLPNSEYGERILKIPHGATVSVGACGPVVTPVKRSGRWCQASYEGYRGWVFDAYLIY